MLIRIAGVSLLALSLATGHAIADDWVAVKLRGAVQQQVAGEWQPLAKGDIVPDSRSVRTLLGGRVEFVRGEEHIELGPNTLIRIYDRGGDKPFTTVAQAIGTVSIEAKVEQVQHFAVETPYIAAVVKGTKFTVVAGRGTATVSVTRGHVAVEDNHDKSHVTVGAGQSAEVEKDKGLSVSGSGTLPVVLTKDDKPLVPTPTAKVAAATSETAPIVAPGGLVPVPDQPAVPTVGGTASAPPSGETPPSLSPQKGPGKSGSPSKDGPGEDGDKPAPPDKPSKPDKPGKDDGPGKSGQGDSGKPDKPEKPENGDKPDKADKPAKDDKPEKDEKPKPSKK